MIRHGKVVRRFGGSVVSLAVQSLPISMVEPAFGALLVPAVGLPSLLAPPFLATSITTVCVSAVAPGADEK